MLADRPAADTFTIPPKCTGWEPAGRLRHAVLFCCSATYCTNQVDQSSVTMRK